MLHRAEIFFRHVVGWALGALLWRPGRRRLSALLGTARRVVLVRIDDRVGEALLTTPLVAALKDRYAVELLVHPRCVRVLEGLPGVGAVHPFERRWLRWGPFGAELRRLRALTEGAVVVNCASWAEHSGTAALLSRLVAPRACVVGPAVRPAGTLMDVAVPARADTRSEHLQRLHLLSPLLGEVPEAPLTFRRPRVTEAVRDFAAATRAPFAVVNPGGRLDERRVPPDVFSAACRRLLDLGHTPVVTWGPGEEGLASAVVAAVPGSSLAPPTSLDELAALMQQARLVVCNNTGPMHLAVAVGTPTLALFHRMPLDRWGHPRPPHRMLDLTPCASREEMRARLDAELTRMLPSAGQVA